MRLSFKNAQNESQETYRTCYDLLRVCSRTTTGLCIIDPHKDVYPRTLTDKIKVILPSNGSVGPGTTQLEKSHIQEDALLLGKSWPEGHSVKSQSHFQLYRDVFDHEQRHPEDLSICTFQSVSKSKKKDLFCILEQYYFQT